MNTKCCGTCYWGYEAYLHNSNLIQCLVTVRVPASVSPVPDTRPMEAHEGTDCPCYVDKNSPRPRRLRALP